MPHRIKAPAERADRIDAPAPAPDTAAADRRAFGEDFFAMLCADFVAHGGEAIAKLRGEKPADYLKVIAALLPKHAEAASPADRDEDPFALLSDADLADALAVVRALAGARDEAAG
jgi:hypothetical protein